MEKLASQKQDNCLRWKLYCFSSQSHLTPWNFVSSSDFCLSFAFCVFAFWLTESTTANLQGLTHSNPSKNTNQVTLCNEQIYQPLGRKITWFTTAQILTGVYFPLFIFCWPKKGRARLIDQWQWYLRYDILKNKKFDVIPKISVEFIIVILQPFQMLGFKCLVWRGLATRLVYEKRKYKRYFMNEKRLKEHNVFFSKERFLVYPT